MARSSQAPQLGVIEFRSSRQAFRAIVPASNREESSAAGDRMEISECSRASCPWAVWGLGDWMKTVSASCLLTTSIEIGGSRRTAREDGVEVEDHSEEPNRLVRHRIDRQDDGAIEDLARLHCEACLSYGRIVARARPLLS